MNRLKRVLAVHDISCVGKCSLTVALPIISACGVECSVLPTAVLSTHTGGFAGFTYRDLTEDIIPIVEHWQSLQLHFDSIYTGFLGSYEQIDLVCELFDRLKSKDTLIVVDPVMADHGELYSIFDESFPQAMKKVCEKADVLVPNITEACLLLEEVYLPGPYSREYIENLLQKLAKLGPAHVVLTGVHFDNEELGAACLNSKTGEIEYAFSTKIEGSYHGTGDIFGSVLTGALMREMPMGEAMQLAVDFTVGSILRTKAEQTESRYGVNFEAGLAELGGRLSHK